MKVYIVSRQTRCQGDGVYQILKVFLDEAKAMAYADTQEDEFYYIWVDEMEIDE